MNSNLRYLWEKLRTSYWFVPAVLAVGAIVLSVITVEIDRGLSEHETWKVSWTYTGGPEGARAVLATVAGSMITVAGVVFSITIVALTLASAQFGPRLLRNFIRDRRNQVVLGTFTATFLYCLLVLRTVRGTDHQQFVPGVSVTIGILLAVTNLGVLVYFIHHVAISIQATAVVQSVSQELHEAIDRLWPNELGEERASGSAGQTQIPDEDVVPVLAPSSGYVDAINDEALMKTAKDQDLVIRIVRRPGKFATAGTPLALVWPSKHIDDDVRKLITREFILVAQRTPFQDVEFAIDQLVEIAVRALSPGINDPFTAITCIHRLGEALCRLSRRSIPAPERYDENQRLRVVTHPVDFRAVTDAAFHQIRQYGAGSPAVLICLLETLNVIASLARRNDDLSALYHHAELIHRVASRNIPEQADLADIEDRFQLVKRQLTKTNDTAERAAIE